MDCDLSVSSKVGRIAERGVRIRTPSTLWMSTATPTAAAAKDGDWHKRENQQSPKQQLDVTPA